MPASNMSSHPGKQGVTNSVPGIQQNTISSSAGNQARVYRLDPTKICFLDLPGEVRNEIYHWTLLVAPEGPPSKAPRRYHCPDAVLQHLPFTVACKIRAREERIAKREREATEADYVHIVGRVEALRLKDWRSLGGSTTDGILVKPIKSGGLVPGLLALSRAINAEAAPFLYARNKFKFQDTVSQANCLQLFVEIIGPRNAANIKHVRLVNPGRLRHVDLGHPNWISWLELIHHPAMDQLDFTHKEPLMVMAKLTTLEIRLSGRWGGRTIDADDVAMIIYGTIHSWLEAVAAKEGNAEALKRFKALSWDASDFFAERDHSEELKPWLEESIGMLAAQHRG